MLTEKRKLDVDKKIHNYVLTEKKKKKTSSWNTALPPTRRKSPHTKPSAAGMRQCNRSLKPKKTAVLRFNERR
jgi:hypothetical protein